MDCVTNKADTLVLISADSDQVPTIETIKKHFPDKKVKVYFPPSRHSTDLLHVCKPIVFLGENEQKFKNSMLPNEISIDSKKYYKPEKWKNIK